MRLSKLKGKFKGELIANSLTLIGGTGFAQLITILLSPVLTRLYTPEEFGGLGFYLGVVSVLGLLVSGRYEMALMLPKTNRESKRLLILAFYITMLSSFIFFVCFLLFKNKLHSLFNLNTDVYFYFIPLSICFVGLINIGLYYNNRQKRYKLIAGNHITRSVFVNIVYIVFAFINIDFFNILVLGLILGQFVEVVFLWRPIIIELIKNPNVLLSHMQLLSLARKYSIFPKFSLPSTLLNAASIQIPIYMLSLFFSKVVVGYYYQAQRIMTLPITLVARNIGHVYYQEIAANRDDDFLLRNKSLNIFNRLFLLIFIPLSIIAAFGDYIFLFVFGSGWKEAGQFAQVITPWLLMNFLASPFTLLFELFQKQKILMKFNILLFGSRVLALLVGYLFFESALISVFAFSLVSFFTYFALLASALSLVHIHVREIFSLLFKYMFPFVGLLLFVRYLM